MLGSIKWTPVLIEELLAVDKYNRIESVYDSWDVTQYRQQQADPELNLQNEQRQNKLSPRQQRMQQENAEGVIGDRFNNQIIQINNRRCRPT